MQPIRTILLAALLLGPAGACAGEARPHRDDPRAPLVLGSTVGVEYAKWKPKHARRGHPGRHYGWVRGRHLGWHKRRR
jgi:hypothetical protein